MLRDVLIHIGLEAVGSAALWVAWKWCRVWQHEPRLHHQLAVWLVIAIPMSYLTVRLVG